MSPTSIIVGQHSGSVHPGIGWEPDTPRRNTAPASVLGDEVEEAGLPPERGAWSPSHSFQVLQEGGPKNLYWSARIS